MFTIWWKATEFNLFYSKGFRMIKRTYLKMEILAFYPELLDSTKTITNRTKKSNTSEKKTMLSGTH